MSKDDVISIAKALAGKRAKSKSYTTEPDGTKESKLPKDVQAGLEEHFNCRLDKVRVHTGGNVKEICKELKASAFTIDQNMYFRKSGDAKSVDVLTQELTHVLQQGGGKMSKKTKDGKALVRG